MNIRSYNWASAVFAFLMIASQASALTVPFSEDFASDTANWKNTASLDPTYIASGGPDGSGYISTELSFFNLPAGPVVFRAQDEFGSSGGAFQGNWLVDGAGALRTYVRHDAPIALDFFARFATPNNFPGVAVEVPTSVQPGVWTPIEFDIRQSNPLLTVEGPPSFYDSVFGNLGHVQIGVSLPAALVTDASAYTFDLDGASIAVPEPTSCLLAFGAAMSGLLWLRAHDR